MRRDRGLLAISWSEGAETPPGTADVDAAAAVDGKAAPPGTAITVAPDDDGCSALLLVDALLDASFGLGTAADFTVDTSGSGCCW